MIIWYPLIRVVSETEQEFVPTEYDLLGTIKASGGVFNFIKHFRGWSFSEARCQKVCAQKTDAANKAAYVKKVIDSCKTMEQLNNVAVWASTVTPKTEYERDILEKSLNLISDYEHTKNK